MKYWINWRGTRWLPVKVSLGTISTYRSRRARLHWSIMFGEPMRRSVLVAWNGVAGWLILCKANHTVEPRKLAIVRIALTGDTRPRVWTSVT